MGQKRAEIIRASVTDCGDEPPFQSERDLLICSAIRQLRTLKEQLGDVDIQLARLLEQTDYRLTTIRGIDVVLAAELVALIGDVTRFRTVDKFLAYTGIAPVTFGSGESETRVRSRFGRRELLALFHQIACHQLVVHHKTGEPRNPEAKAYFEKHHYMASRLPYPEVRLHEMEEPLDFSRGSAGDPHACLV